MNAAIYVRVSTRTQETEGTSLDSQLAACLDYAAARGAMVDDGDIYREVHTGTELWERPQLTRLREAIRGRVVDLVVIHASDRLSRDAIHLGMVLSEADHAGVAIEFVTEPIDNSPEGQLIQFVRGYAGKIEHAKIMERSQRGRRTRVQAGKPLPGPRALYGYQWADEQKSRLVVDPATAPVVRRIFEELARGRSLRKVKTLLNDDGIPTPTGKDHWGQSTVHCIASHPAYAGNAAARRWVVERERGGRRHCAIRPEDEQIALPEGTIPPLVPPDTFAAVQGRLARNKAASPGRLRDPEQFLVRGYVRCGHCGQAVPATRCGGAKREEVPIYRLSTTIDSHRRCCNISMRAAILDAAVWAKVEALLNHPERIAAELARLRGEDTTADDLAAVERAMREPERKRANLARRLADIDDDESAAAIVAEINRLGARLRALGAEREAVLARRATWEAANDRLADLERWCRAVAGKLAGATFERKRQAIEALGVSVKIYAVTHSPRYEITAEIPLDAPAPAPFPVHNLSQSW